jgi:HSP20 family protein
MSLVKWNPERRLFPINWMEDFFADNFKPAVNGISIPAVNISENKTAFKLNVAAPGFKKEDFKLEVQNGYLVISAETKEEKEDKDEKYTRQEYFYNSFSRSFSLPEEIKEDNISAQYEDGLLKVTIPKLKVEETAKMTKQIAVK